MTSLRQAVQRTIHLNRQAGKGRSLFHHLKTEIQSNVIPQSTTCPTHPGGRFSKNCPLRKIKTPVTQKIHNLSEAVNFSRLENLMALRLSKPSSKLHLKDERGSFNRIKFLIFDLWQKIHNLSEPWKSWSRLGEPSYFFRLKAVLQTKNHKLSGAVKILCWVVGKSPDASKTKMPNAVTLIQKKKPAPIELAFIYSGDGS